LDQLTVAEPLKGGLVRIMVAVADVDALVKKGSATDRRAQVNTTSVYTAAEVFPMLPERLSTDLTSLGEDQERLAIVTDMTIDADGAVRDSDVYRATVRNRAKLAYDGVAAWLDGSAPPPTRVTTVQGLDDQLRLQDRVAQAMKRIRQQHGALVLQTLEAHAVFDGDDLAELRTEDENRAKALIEDFMIAANIAIAKYLERKGLPSLRRVLRSPERWAKIVTLAAGLGDSLPPEPDAAALSDFLRRRRDADPARFPDVSLAVVKLLGRGEYVIETPGQRTDGHFALAVQDYTHSTAPNRRFPDLVTQRLVKSAISGAPLPYSTDELRELASHCTEQEDNAAKVERRVRKSAAALLLRARVGESFDAIVTGASEKGTWVRALQPPVEGKVVKGFQGLNVGDRVRVRLVHTDVQEGFVDFAC
ncbi:MAG: RNB domain-containing ribonuclease, partial [Myxococcota bacterium]|nr:RNB domain-containing ribonuclease [Myxococcota bacterium]